MESKGFVLFVWAKKRALHMIDDPVALEVALERSKDKHIQELERKVRSLELRVLYLKS